MSARDRELGLDRPIRRRDFLNGVALGTAGILAAPRWLHALEREAARSSGAYPPALTGLRGSHDGSFEVAHALRDGSFWDAAGAPEPTGEDYDLVVVGGGLSGLAAALFYAEAAGGAPRILVLDNHDDFGGHAKRNEFEHDGRLLIGYGGTFAIDSAGPWSAVSKELVVRLGIDVARWPQAVNPALYASRELGAGFFFDRESFGRDLLLRDPAGSRRRDAAPSPEEWAAFLEAAPFSEAAKRDLARLATETRDPFPGLGDLEKKGRLARMSYADYLTQTLGYDAGLLPYFQARPHGLYGVGIDGLPAQDAWGLGLPGFDGLRLEPTAGPGMNLDAVPYGQTEPNFFHFPDGNATLARLLVRRLVPGAVPGTTAEDVVTARVDYARLDAPEQPVRIRLRSTVVRLAHRGDPATARELELAYVQDGHLRSLRARRAILACWHQAIPYFCPELPAEQKQALAYATKVPIVYTNVLLRSWESFVALGVHEIHAPNGFHHATNLSLPVSVGQYRFPGDPRQPMLVHMARTPCQPGLPVRDQHLAGRVELLSLTFEDFERRIREQLGRMLGPGGFDPARDVAAITVNRWPHGYAYQYNSLVDGFWLENVEPPCVRARRPFGLLAIANSDAAAYAYTDAAIDHAHRAVLESLPRRG